MVEIWPDENTSLVLRSAPKAEQPEGKQGLLLLNTRPWSHVAVDGEHVGVTSVSQRLAPGRHAVKITFAHGEVIQEQITVKAGETTNLIRRAQTPDSFAYKRQHRQTSSLGSAWSCSRVVCTTTETQPKGRRTDKAPGPAIPLAKRGLRVRMPPHGSGE